LEHRYGQRATCAHRCGDLLDGSTDGGNGSPTRFGKVASPFPVRLDAPPSTRAPPREFPARRHDDATTSLGQSAMRSDGVHSTGRVCAAEHLIATAGLVAPELQIVNEVSVVGLFELHALAGPERLGSGSDIQPDYTAELALATSDLLIDRVSLFLTAVP